MAVLGLQAQAISGVAAVSMHTTKIVSNNELTLSYAVLAFFCGKPLCSHVDAKGGHVGATVCCVDSNTLGILVYQ